MPMGLEDSNWLTDGSLNYIFACAFIFLSLTFYTLYTASFAAFTLEKFLNRFVCSRDEYLRIGSITVAPLRCRILLKDVRYVNSDLSLRIVDTYFSVAFWGNSGGQHYRKVRDQELLKRGQRIRFQNTKGSNVEGCLTEDIKVSVESKIKVQHEGKIETFRVQKRNLLVKENIGRLRLHMNGFSLVWYNSTSKYKTLAELIKAKDPEIAIKVPDHSCSSDLPISASGSHEHRPLSFFERFMKFLHYVSFDIRTGTISAGCCTPGVPYFLHLSFSHSIGMFFHVRSPCLSSKYRSVLDLTLRHTGLQWVPCDQRVSQEEASGGIPQENVKKQFRDPRNSLFGAAQLMLSGDKGEVLRYDSKRSTGAFHTILENNTCSSLHVVYYWDECGMNSSISKVGSVEQLPKKGLELEIDSRKVTLSTLSEVCRKALVKHLFPDDYLPRSIYQPESCKVQPSGTFELSVDFVRETLVELHFKHRNITPQLPYGIEDSGRNGLVSLRFDKGSHFLVQHPLLLNPKTLQELSEFYVELHNVHIITSMNDSLLLRCPHFLLHFDSLIANRHDTKHLRNLIIEARHAEAWYEQDFVYFFHDLIADLLYGRSIHFAENFQEHYWNERYHFSEFVPSVTNLEIFVEEIKVYLIANEHNVLRSVDHCCASSNAYLMVLIGCADIRLRLPSEHYCIFQENEQQSMWNVGLHGIQVRAMIPEDASTGCVFCSLDTLQIEVGYSVFSLSRLHLLERHESQSTNSTSGPSARSNMCRIELYFDTLEATLEPRYVRLLVHVFNNYIGEESSFLTSSTCKFFLHRESGKNIKSQLRCFMVRNEIRNNDLEFQLTLNFKESLLRFAESTETPGYIQLRVMLASYTMQTTNGLAEHTVTLSPVIISVAQSQEQQRISDCIVLSGLSLSFSAYKGPFPLALTYHSRSDLSIDDLECNMSLQVVHDLMRVSELYYSFDYESDTMSFYSQPSAESQFDSPVLSRRKPLVPNKFPDVTLKDSDAYGVDDLGTISSFLEWYSKKFEAANEACRMCHRAVHVQIRRSNVELYYVNDESVHYVCKFPKGIHYTSSSLHDGNANHRWTIDAPLVSQHMFATSHRHADFSLSNDQYVEAWCARISFFLRRTTCYGAGEGFVRDQYLKQRSFIATSRLHTNDMNGFYFDQVPLSESLSPKDLKTFAQDLRFHSSAFESSISLRRVFPTDNVCERNDSQHYHTSKEIPQQNDEFYVANFPIFEKRVGTSSFNALRYAATLPKQSMFLGSLSPVPHTTFKKFLVPSYVPETENERGLSQGRSVFPRLITVDNERRSRKKTSTYHWHIHFTERVDFSFLPTVLVQALLLVAQYFAKEKTRAGCSSTSDQSGVNQSDVTGKAFSVKKRMNWLYNYIRLLSITVPEIRCRLILPHTSAKHHIGPDSTWINLEFQMNSIHALFCEENPAKSQYTSLPQQKTLSVRSENILFLARYVHALRNVCSADSANISFDRRNILFRASITPASFRAKQYKERDSELFSDRFPFWIHIAEVDVQSSKGSFEALYGSWLNFTSSLSLLPLEFKKWGKSGSRGADELRKSNNGDKAISYSEDREIDFEMKLHLGRFSYSHRFSLLESGDDIPSHCIVSSLKGCISREIQRGRMACVLIVSSLEGALLPSFAHELNFPDSPSKTNINESNTISNATLHIQIRVSNATVDVRQAQRNYVRLTSPVLNFCYASNPILGAPHFGEFTKEFLIDVTEMKIEYMASLGLLEKLKNLEGSESVVLSCNIRGFVANSEFHPDQSVHCSWKSMYLDLPHRLNTMDTAVPQMQDFIRIWSDATSRKHNDSRLQANRTETKVIWTLDLPKLGFRATILPDLVINCNVSRISMYQSISHGRHFQLHITDPRLSSMDRTVLLPTVHLFKVQQYLSSAPKMFVLVQRLEAEISRDLFASCLGFYRKTVTDLVEFVSSKRTYELTEATLSTEVISSYNGTAVIHLMGVHLSVLSQICKATCSVSEIRVNMLSHGRSDGLRWQINLPKIELFVKDYLSHELASQSSHPLSTGSEKTVFSETNVPVSRSTLSDVRFTWAYVYTCLRVRNYNPPSENTKIDEDDSTTTREELHASRLKTPASSREHNYAASLMEYDCPNLDIMTRLGAVSRIIEIAKEYKEEWHSVEKEITDQTEVAKKKLQSSAVYNTVGFGSKFDDMESSKKGTKSYFATSSVTIRSFALLVPAGDRFCAVSLSEAVDLKNSFPINTALESMVIVQEQCIPLYAIKVYWDALELQIQIDQSQKDPLRIIRAEGVVETLTLYVHQGVRPENKSSWLNILKKQKIIGGSGYFESPTAAECRKTSNGICVPRSEVSLELYMSSKEVSADVQMLIDGPLATIDPMIILCMKDVCSILGALPDEEKARSNTKKILQSLNFLLEMEGGSLRLATGVSRHHSEADWSTRFPDTEKNAYQPFIDISMTNRIYRPNQAQEMASLVTLPLPKICALSNYTCTYSSNAAIDSFGKLHVEFFPENMEISPNVMYFFEQYDTFSRDWSKAMEKRIQSLINIQKITEKEDMIPIPTAFLKMRIARILNVNKESNVALSPSDSNLQTKKSSIWQASFRSVPFRVSLIGPSLSSLTSSLNFFIEEDGYINAFIAKHNSLSRKATHVTLLLQKVRVEVQARMEIKFLEISVPIFVVEASPRTNSLRISFGAMEHGTKKPEIICRCTHISQWYTFIKVWIAKKQEAITLSSSQQITELPTVNNTEHIKVNPPRKQFYKFITLVGQLETAKIHVDLSPMNKYDLTVSRLVGSMSQTCLPESGTSLLTIFEIQSSDFSSKCEGLLTGSLTTQQGIGARYTKHYPDGHQELPSFQTYLTVPQVRFTLRERHVRDLFSADITGAGFRFYDENIRGSTCHHHVFVDAMTDRTHLSVSPDIEQALVRLAVEVRKSMSSEKRKAYQKLEGYTHNTSTKNALSAEQTIALQNIPHMLCRSFLPIGQLKFSLRDVVLTLGELSQGYDSAALLWTSRGLTAQYAQCVDKNISRKILELTIHSWDIFRKSQDRKVSSIIGASGQNQFEMSTSQITGSPDVRFIFKFLSHEPWHGSPHVVDFEVINRTVRSFTQRQKWNNIESSGESGSIFRELEDIRSFHASVETHFVPEIRVVGDATFHIRTVLGWLGVNEDAIPRLLYIHLMDKMEHVLAIAYQHSCPVDVLKTEMTNIAKHIRVFTDESRIPTDNGRV